MKKISKLLVLILTISLVFQSFSFATYGAENKSQISAEDSANYLYNLNLFKGDEKGFSLEKRPTRAEGIAMIIRLIGKEKETLEANYKHPFNDVPNWASDYVGYAYEEGISKGKSDSKFGATDFMTANDYITFILRTLDYNDTSGDFSWKNSILKAQNIGLISQDQADFYLNNVFQRSGIAEISYQALNQKIKGEQMTLADFLIEAGVITKDEAILAKLNVAVTNADQPPVKEEYIDDTEISNDDSEYYEEEEDFYEEEEELFEEEEFIDQPSEEPIKEEEIKQEPATDPIKKEDTYTISFNAYGGSGTMSDYKVKFGDKFSISKNKFTRSNYTFTGWRVKRNSDASWYVAGKGWFTQSQIESKGYTKKLYSDGQSLILDKTWTDGKSGNNKYTFYAIWKSKSKSNTAYELTQISDVTCTLVSSAMMMRKYADATNKDYKKITENNLKPTAWVSNAGLKFDFTFNGIRAKTKNIDNELKLTSKNSKTEKVKAKKAKLITLLKASPSNAGIVAYNFSKPHAVWLTKYDSSKDTFYAIDPSPLNKGEIALAKTTLPGKTQDDKIDSINAYWYIVK